MKQQQSNNEEQLIFDFVLNDIFINEQIKLTDELLRTFRQMRMKEHKECSELKVKFDYLSNLLKENRELYERSKKRAQT